jgi:hypothetical protein
MVGCFFTALTQSCSAARTSSECREGFRKDVTHISTEGRGAMRGMAVMFVALLGAPTLAMGQPSQARSEVDPENRTTG